VLSTARGSHRRRMRQRRRRRELATGLSAECRAEDAPGDQGGTECYHLDSGPAAEYGGEDVLFPGRKVYFCSPGEPGAHGYPGTLVSIVRNYYCGDDRDHWLVQWEPPNNRLPPAVHPDWLSLDIVPYDPNWDNWMPERSFFLEHLLDDAGDVT